MLEGILLAKKWQDVEFVDYKERQKRRRMRKRINAEEELSDSYRGRWSTLTVTFVTLFVTVIVVSAYFLMTEDELGREMQANMYLQSRLISGNVNFREFLRFRLFVHFIESKIL